jgi:ferrous iron transport protein B
MHRLGLHGMSIVPIVLGLGCNVPGALAGRILETRRERFIVATVMSIFVPCMAQSAMIAALVGSSSDSWLEIAAAFGAIFATLALTALVLSRLLNVAMRGESTELLIDIPPYRIPFMRGLVKKLVMRLWWFLREALPFVFLGVILIQLLELTGVIALCGRLAAPVVENWLGLPREAVAGMVAGFLRKDMAVGMLQPLGLDWRQAAVASVVLTMYFPCVATFSVLLKEFGVKDMGKAALLMVGTALAAGSLLNLVLGAV